MEMDTIMSQVIGVRLRRAGKVYYFDAAGIAVTVADQVVVETVRGIEIGTVAIAPEQVIEEQITEPLKPILRKADDADLKKVEEQKKQEQETLATCRQYIERYNLPMKLLSCECNLDDSRLTFYFSAEGRVDFRELVKELTSVFKKKVELRQIGPRDEAKLLGGIGRCGRILCCNTYLCEFDPISIKMAKEQDLPLNPIKISGVCGRLLCCLAYENTQYQEMKARLPGPGQKVSTPSGPGSVVWSNPLKETVVVEMQESQAMVEFPLSQLTFEEGLKKTSRGRSRRRTTGKPTAEKENSSSSDKPSGNGSARIIPPGVGQRAGE